MYDFTHKQLAEAERIRRASERDYAQARWELARIRERMIAAHTECYPIGKIPERDWVLKILRHVVDGEKVWIPDRETAIQDAKA